MRATGKAVDPEQQIGRFIDGPSPSLSIEMGRIFSRTLGMTLNAVMSDANMER
jgi:hypothetical protein